MLRDYTQMMLCNHKDIALCSCTQMLFGYKTDCPNSLSEAVCDMPRLLHSVIMPT